MNKNKTYKDFSKRFDQEAEQGFNATPGAEAFFNELENPFTTKKYKVVNRRVNPRLLLFELALVIGLLLLLKYTWPTHEVSRVELPVTEKEKIVLPVSSSTALVPIQQPKEEQLPKKTTIHRSRQTSFIRPVEIQNDTTAVAPVNHLQADPAPVDSAPAPVIAVYHYADYRDQYKLHYLADLLVVDYGDSTMRPKLKPILSGVPASFETASQWKKLNEKNEPSLVVVGENLYLEKLEKGMKAFAKGEWTKAAAVFRTLHLNHPGDQNALFYGALCAYESGNYTQSLALMQELKKTTQPVFEQDADYYIALSLLKNGQSVKALEQLERINHSDSFYREKAQLLLKELK